MMTRDSRWEKANHASIRTKSVSTNEPRRRVTSSAISISAKSSRKKAFRKKQSLISAI